MRSYSITLSARLPLDEPTRYRDVVTSYREQLVEKAGARGSFRLHYHGRCMPLAALRIPPALHDDARSTFRSVALPGWECLDGYPSSSREFAAVK